MTASRGAVPAGRSVLLVGTLLATLTTVPYFLAWHEPPRGYRFLGFFFQVEDVYNYLTYVQQAEDGALLFVNKAAGPDQRPVLVNVEWLLVGRLSSLLGRQPALAYRCVGVAAVFALLGGVLALLRRTGVPPGHTTAALLLVAFGAGLGGLRYLWLGLALAVFRPFAISLQFLVCIGVPLFVLGARGLSRAAPRATALLAIGLSSTSVVALGIVLQPNPRWFVPQERFDVALELRRTCRPGQRVLAPPDIGLYAGALSSCSPLVAHPGTSDFERRVASLERFYGPASASERRRLLADEKIDHVVVPGDPGPDPVAWLEAGSGFSRVSRVSGPREVLSVYSRMPGTDPPGSQRLTPRALDDHPHAPGERASSFR